MASSSGLVFAIITATLAVSFLAVDVVSAFAQESNNTFINRIAIWDLFYRLMVIAFTVGAVIMGVLAYVIFRFRESNKKNIPGEPVEGQH
ncbi:MAG TPA: heme transporter CcmC [Nitrososphaera sp.]|jgi:heme/copper-type cytochrome/quinol oxidase subunit 2